MKTDEATVERVAQAIWLAMVNDELPDRRTLELEGYFDAASAVLDLLAAEAPGGHQRGDALVDPNASPFDMPTGYRQPTG